MRLSPCFGDVPLGARNIDVLKCLKHQESPRSRINLRRLVPHAIRRPIFVTLVCGMKPDQQNEQTGDGTKPRYLRQAPGVVDDFSAAMRCWQRPGCDTLEPQCILQALKLWAHGGSSICSFNLAGKKTHCRCSLNLSRSYSFIFVS